MKRFHEYHRTKLGMLIFVLVELAIAYGFASLAIDRGNLWWYLLALIFLVGALQNLFKLIGEFLNGHKS